MMDIWLTEGIIRHRGRGYEMDPQAQARALPPHNRSEEDDDDEDDRTVAQEGVVGHAIPPATGAVTGTGAPMDGTLETQETCESIFTSTPPRVGQKPPPAKASKGQPRPQQLNFVHGAEGGLPATEEMEQEAQRTSSHKRQRVTHQHKQVQFLTLSYYCLCVCVYVYLTVADADALVYGFRFFCLSSTTTCRRKEESAVTARERNAASSRTLFTRTRRQESRPPLTSSALSHASAVKAACRHVNVSIKHYST